MSRPTVMKVDGTVYWTLMTYDADGILVDADSTPTVAVRKNGAAVGDAVTVTKRAATTGIYDCSHAPSGEAEGDTFIYEESVTISSQAYLNPWSLEVEALEAGGGSGGGDATEAKQDTIIANIAALNDFDPVNDAVANVTLVGTTTTNTDMRGTDGANTVAPVDVSADVAAILADTNELQLNQGDWLTADLSTLNDLSSSDIENAVWDAAVSGHNVGGTFGKFLRILKEGTISVEGSVNDLSATTTSFVTDLTNTTSSFYHDKLIVFVSGQNAGQTRHIESYDGSTKAVVVSDAFSFAPANGDEFLILATHEFSNTEIAAEVVSQMQVVSDDFKADVSGLATQSSLDVVDGIVDSILLDTDELQGNQGDWATATTVVASNMRGTDNAILAASTPANWSTLIVGTGADAGKVTTSNPAAGSGSAHTAQDVADLILITPANKLATDASGNVEANNMRGTDGANTVAPVDVSSDVAAILADTNELQQNQGDWATATGFATPSDVLASQGVITTAIDGLHNFDPVNDVVSRVTLVDTTTDLTNGGGDATSANQTTIINAINSLNDFDPTNDVVAHVTLVDTTTDVTNGGIQEGIDYVWTNVATGNSDTVRITQ
jgi:hypothetical protein